jgi:hypothetical protein
MVDSWRGFYHSGETNDSGRIGGRILFSVLYRAAGVSWAAGVASPALPFGWDRNPIIRQTAKPIRWRWPHEQVGVIIPATVMDLSKLKENPILSVTTAMTGILAALNSFVDGTGLPPFWGDCGVTILITMTVIYWGMVMARSIAANVSARGRAARLADFFRGTGTALLLLLFLVMLLIWTARLPVRHLLTGKWSICGEVIVTCSRRPCLFLFDEKGRRIMDDCVVLQDDSGYFHIPDQKYWVYRPVSLGVACESSGAPIHFPMDNQMFSSSCDAIINLK